MAENEVDVDVRLDKDNRTAADAARIRKNTEDAVPPFQKPGRQPTAPAQPPTPQPTGDPARPVRTTNDEVTRLRTNIAQTETGLRNLIAGFERLARTSKLPSVRENATRLAEQSRGQLTGLGGIDLAGDIGSFTPARLRAIESRILSSRDDSATVRRLGAALREKEATILRRIADFRRRNPPPAPPSDDPNDEQLGGGLAGNIKFGARFVLGAANLPGPDRFADQIVRRMSLATIGAVGVAGVTAYGIYKVVEGYAEAQDRARAFNVAALDSGQTLETLTSYATDFRGQIIGTYEDAQKLAGALATLQTATGGQSNAGRLATAVSTIATARKLSADDAAQLTRSIAGGDPKAYDQLTGRSGQLLLDNYARSIGTVTSKLTEMERAQVLSNGLMQQSGRFAEEAAKRIHSAAGSYASFKASVADFIADYPEAAFNTFLRFRTPGQVYQEKLGELGADITDAQLREQARKAREEAAKTQAEKLLLNLQGTNARDLEESFKRYGQRSFGTGAASSASRILALRDLETSVEGRNRNTTTGIFGGGLDLNNGINPTDLQAFRDKIKETRQREDDADFEFRKNFVARLRLLDIDDHVIRTALSQTDRLAAERYAIRDPNAARPVEGTFFESQQRYMRRFQDFSERNFRSPVDAAYARQANAAQTIKDLYADVNNLSTEDFESFLTRAIEQSKAAAKEIFQLQQQAGKQLRALGRESQDSLRSAFVAQNADNPFVKLFVEGDAAIEATARKFRNLGPEIVKQITDIQRATQKTDFEKLKLTTDLDVLKLRQEAAALSRPFFGTTGAEDRQLKVLDRQIEAATKIPQLLNAAARVGRTGPLSTGEQRNLFNQQFSNLRSFFESSLATGGLYGLEGAARSGAALTGLYESAPDAVKRRLSSGQRGLLQEAYRQQAGFQLYQIQKEQENARITDQQVRDAYERAALIDRSSAPDRLKLEQLINVIDSIPENDRGPLRQRAAQARNQLAQIREGDAEDARKRQKELGDLVTALKSIVTADGLKITSDQALVRNVIENDPDNDVPNTPAQPKPSVDQALRNRFLLGT